MIGFSRIYLEVHYPSDVSPILVMRWYSLANSRPTFASFLIQFGFIDDRGNVVTQILIR
jgi:hypothetical protein